jgi:hypothetical protein
MTALLFSRISIAEMRELEASGVYLILLITLQPRCLRILSARSVALRPVLTDGLPILAPAQDAVIRLDPQASRSETLKSVSE